MACASDEELMKRFRDARDESAFEELMGRHRGPAYGAALRLLGNAPDAEDAVQEAFLRVVRGPRAYDPERPFGPWFYAILRNACLDLHRKRLRRSEAVRVSSELIETVAADGRGEANEILGLLSGGERDVLTLKLHYNMTFHEIGAALGCSEEAAKKRAQRALARLRAALAAEG